MMSSQEEEDVLAGLDAALARVTATAAPEAAAPPPPQAEQWSTVNTTESAAEAAAANLAPAYLDAVLRRDRDGRFRFADYRVDPSGASLTAVREDHGERGDLTPKEVVNEVVSVSLDGSGTMTVLATGKDFYASPRMSQQHTHTREAQPRMLAQPLSARRRLTSCSRRRERQARTPRHS